MATVLSAKNGERDYESCFDYNSDGKIDDFDLAGVDFGGGKVMSVINLKLPSRQTSEVQLYLDKEGEIAEVSDENNKVELALS